MAWEDVPDAEYRRISDDKTGEGRGIGRQGEDNAALAASAGRTVRSPPYVDPSVSAARLGSVRPDFERLLDDLEAGIVNGIVVHVADRLVRRFGDLQRLIDIWDRASRQGRTIRPIVTATRQYDLHVQTDVMLLAMDVIAGDQEIRSSRRRAARSHLDNARQGRIAGGPRPFGWNDDRRTLHPLEAVAVREAVFDVMAGVAGWGRIATRWNHAGLLTPFGNTWIAANVRSTLRNPRLAGIRTYKEEALLREDGSYVIGQWQPILTVDEWDAYWTVVGPDRSGGRDRPQQEYLLSGILRCSKCTKKLTGKQTSSKGLIYACPPRGSGGCGGTSVRGRAAEKIVQELVVQHLQERHSRQVTAAAFTRDDELAEVRRTLGLLFREIQEGKPSSRRMATIDVLETREAELIRQKIQSAACVAREVRLTGDVRESWQTESKATRRQVILDVVATIVVMPHAGANNRVNPDRLVPVWVEESGQTGEGNRRGIGSPPWSSDSSSPKVGVTT